MPRKTMKVAYFNLLPCEKNGKALEKARKSPKKISYHSGSLHPLTEKQAWLKNEDEDTCQKVSLAWGSYRVWGKAWLWTLAWASSLTAKSLLLMCPTTAPAPLPKQGIRTGTVWNLGDNECQVLFHAVCSIPIYCLPSPSILLLVLLPPPTQA